MEKAVRTAVLVVLIAQSAFILLILRVKTPLRTADVVADAGKNYSLLIDDERFPIKARAGQTIRLEVFDTRRAPIPLPKRTIIKQSTEQSKMAKLSESRFQFYYNTVDELHFLYQREKLADLRDATDWQTVLNVLGKTRRELRLGMVRVYPTQNASDLLASLRDGKEDVFCAQYCYLTVQFLQALGYYARYLTINGHEVCEVWVPSAKKWICLDPTNGWFFQNEHGDKLSALEIARATGGVFSVDAARSAVLPVGPNVSRTYQKIWYWLCNDLATKPVNIYDLNKYRVRAVLHSADIDELDLGDLYSVAPDELYSAPTRNKT